MGTDFDAYRILEVDPSAAQDEIDAAFRRLLAANIGGSADPAFLEIETAFRMLSDPNERRAYDERRASGPVAIEAVDAAALGPAVGDPSAWDKAPWRGPDVGRGILLAIVITIVGLVPLSLLAVLVAGDADAVDEDPEALAISLAASAVFQFTALGVAWWFSLRKYGLDWSALGVRRPERGSWWLPFALFGGAMGILVVYGLFLQLLDFEPDTDLPDAVYDNVLPLTVALILTVLIAPVIEEIFFRGFIFRGLARSWGLVGGALASALLFGIAHALNPDGIYVIAAIAAIGLLFAWGTYYARSVLPAMGAHFMFNLLQMIIVTAQ